LPPGAPRSTFPELNPPHPTTAADAVSLRALVAGALALGGTAAAVGASFFSCAVGFYLVPALAVWLLVIGVLRSLRAEEGHRGPLGAATLLTLGRGWLVSALAGFILVPPQVGFQAWVPAALYTTAAVFDLVDGYVARKLRQESALGGRLDVILDALGLVVGPLAAIALGRLPPWYLLVSAAYYLFHLGLWWRKRRGLPSHLERLRPSRYTRMYAGYQMGLVATVLFPVLGPPGTTIAATMFMVPNLFLFARDYLVTSDRLDPDSPRHRRLLAAIAAAARLLLPLFRTAAAAGLVLLVARGALPPALLVLALLLVLGVATRLIAFGATIALALVLARDPSPLMIAIYVATVLALLGGGGALSLWTPEERWALSRAGERSS
jgi:CDP-diacylglycerol---glycerol-3-phosphate 3-phosphatidyltransferase